jgi:succinylglutamic semialdehyde dehydrogenase
MGASSATGVLISVSPADTGDRIGEFPFSIEAARVAVDRARAAQEAWASQPEAARIAALERLRERFVARKEDLARAIAREVGKPLWEARSEAALLAAKIDSTLGEGRQLVAPHLLPDASGRWQYRPHGVLAVVGPFNFPAHLPNGHIVPALLCGNCVVFKPSEKTPAVGALYAEVVAEAALPAGVFNLVQGDRQVGEWLTSEAAVDGVLFTGSVAVGVAIARANVANPGKLLALELGGKNAAVVLEDADLDLAAYAVAFGAFATAGQRCSSTSRCIVAREVLEPFAAKLVRLARAVRVGHWSDGSVFMGPLISAPAREGFLSACAKGQGEGAEALLEPAVHRAEREGHYVTPAVHLVHHRNAASAYQSEELFGPDVALYPVAGEAEAAAVANDTRFGLCASVFTADRARFETVAARLSAGVLNWNAPTVGASGKLPFGGVKDSGNHRPAGIFSSLYCAWPAALSYSPLRLDHKTAPPGLPLR